MGRSVEDDVEQLCPSLQYVGFPSDDPSVLRKGDEFTGCGSYRHCVYGRVEAFHVFRVSKALGSSAF